GRIQAHQPETLGADQNCRSLVADDGKDDGEGRGATDQDCRAQDLKIGRCSGLLRSCTRLGFAFMRRLAHWPTSAARAGPASVRLEEDVPGAARGLDFCRTVTTSPGISRVDRVAGISLLSPPSLRVRKNSIASASFVDGVADAKASSRSFCDTS